MDNSLILWLFGFTLIAAVAIALWQRARVAKAKDTHEHSALTQGRPDQRATDGAPGVKPQ